MNHRMKVFSVFLISFTATFSLIGCASKSATSTLNSTTPANSIADTTNATLSRSVSECIYYDNKIYQLAQVDLSKSVVGEKIFNWGLGYYKINDIDTNKAIAFQDSDNSFCKYEYLCNQIFNWKSKPYKISNLAFVVTNGVSIDSNAYKLGKLLGKVDNSEIFENAIKSSSETLLVHPDGLDDSANKDECFLATEVEKSESTSKK